MLFGSSGLSQSVATATIAYDITTQIHSRSKIDMYETAHRLTQSSTHEGENDVALRDAPVVKQAQSAEIGLSDKQRRGAIEILNAVPLARRRKFS